MAFFVFFCDNNLEIINRFPEAIKNNIEQYEHEINTTSSKIEFDSTKKLLKQIIKDISYLKYTDTQSLYFLGGLTLIYNNMYFKDNKTYMIDINDDHKLCPCETV